ncbi:hypothetical protein [Microbulbifer sp. JMSA008]|uniref:hypothetical protein n=1 Tax=Microbulbifer sp. JMSA008 TaxID=3243373 RepID=UPI00403A5C4C
MKTRLISHKLKGLSEALTQTVLPDCPVTPGALGSLENWGAAFSTWVHLSPTDRERKSQRVVADQNFRKKRPTKGPFREVNDPAEKTKRNFLSHPLLTET